MKRSGFRKQSIEEIKAKQVIKQAKAKVKPKKKAKKTSLKKAKEKLWELCKQISRKQYGSVCYTCGKEGLEGSNWHTGHFIPSSICTTEMRYSLDNLRPCCYHCNINLSGNWIAYEEHLDQEKGKGFAEQLKIKNRLTKSDSYRIDWYENKINEYQSILRDLETN